MRNSLDSVRQFRESSRCRRIPKAKQVGCAACMETAASLLAGAFRAKGNYLSGTGQGVVYAGS